MKKLIYKNKLVKASKAFVVGLLFIGSVNLKGQSVVTHTPGNFANSTSAIGTTSWSISYNPCLETTKWYYYTPVGPAVDEMSKGLNLTNFNFSIPVNANITGVTAKIVYETATLFSEKILNDTIVRLIVNGIEAGNNLGTGNNGLTFPLQANRTKNYGSPINKWGISTINPIDINSTNFGIAIYLYSFQATHANYGGYCNNIYKRNDSISPLTPDPTPVITVYYTTTTGIIESQSSSPKLYSGNKTIYLKDVVVADKTELFVYSLLGQKVYQAVLEPGQTQVSLNELPTGVYVYKLRIGTNEFSQKIILE